MRLDGDVICVNVDLWLCSSGCDLWLWLVHVVCGCGCWLNFDIAAKVGLAMRGMVGLLPVTNYDFPYEIEFYG